MNNKIKQKAIKKSQELGKQATEENVKALDSQLPAMKKGIIAKIWDKVLFLYEQVKNPEIPVKLKLTIIGALLYLVLPIDIVPDVIPGIGLLDDFAVIVAVVREVSKFTLPKLEKKAEEKFFELGYQKIDEKLKKLFSSILVNTIITFVINVAGCLILILEPFGDSSKTISITIFTIVFVYAVFRFIIYLKDYGQLTKKIVTSVYKKKSFSEGLSDFLCKEYRYIAWFFNGLEIVKSAIPELKEIPDAPQIISTFEKHYKKRAILFFSVLGMYSILVIITKIIIFKLNSL